MLRSAFAMIACLFVFVSPIPAQEFRVYTQVWDMTTDQTEPVARCLTLWHASKVYDFIYAANEVTILEPTQHRIWVVNTSKNIMTCVEFDELKHLLREAEDRLNERIREMDASKRTHELSEALRFQLRPQFEITFDARQQRLKLASSRLTYEIEGQRNVTESAVEAYLNSADWVCRLNYVLHPQPVFPTARLELNQQLRQAKLMPTQVTLRAKMDSPLHLKANHQLTWSLDALDRQSIHKWESLIKDSKTSRVSLLEYQRAIYSQQTAKAR